MPHAPDLTGAALDGRYELHDLIGEGTFGRVYRGRDRRLARQVAIKVIKPWWSEDPQWVRNFEREAQLLARVNDPGIVQIFDVGHATEGLYYVAELVQGESLASRLRRGPLQPWEACEITEQLCRALGHAHAQSVVHRDVKPENVLIAADGRVKVGDFGVATLAQGSTADDPATVLGTPRYMAPEQARGGRTTPATDVYSVGVVLYEMLAGQPPFAGSSAVELALSHLHDPPPPLPVTVPRTLARIVDRAITKSPQERYSTGALMADALAGARRSRAGVRASAPSRAGARNAGNGVAATRVAPRLGARRNVNPAARRRSIALVTGVVLLVAAMAAAALVIGGDTYVRVPALRALSRAKVVAATARLKLRVSFSARYDQAAPDTAIAQSPAAGARLKQGGTVRAVLSAGLAPVKVPALTGQPETAAATLLSSLGLHAATLAVPAPGTKPGVVVRQTPLSGVPASAHSTVTLAVAETPRWRTLTTFAGNGAGRSVPFRIRGTRWRALTTMHYVGSCTFVIFCSGPTAQVTSLDAKRRVASFDLSTGDGKARTFASGADLYEIKITPGSDTARWSVQVQDYY